jgi:hypothetical protein
MDFMRQPNNDPPFHLYLDSREGDGYNASKNYIIRMPRMCSGDGFLCTLVNFTLPNMVYPINAYNNTIYWQITGQLNSFSATVPVGDYSVEDTNNDRDFVFKLEAAMNAVFPGHTVSYNYRTNLFSFAHANGITIFDGTNSMFSLLGFDTVPVAAASITAQYPAELRGSLYVDVSTNLSTYNSF